MGTIRVLSARGQQQGQPIRVAARCRARWPASDSGSSTTPRRTSSSCCAAWRCSSGAQTGLGDVIYERKANSSTPGAAEVLTRLRDVDLVVTRLRRLRSCTSWSLHDAVTLSAGRHARGRGDDDRLPLARPSRGAHARDGGLRRSWWSIIRSAVSPPSASRPERARREPAPGRLGTPTARRVGMRAPRAGLLVRSSSCPTRSRPSRRTSRAPGLDGRAADRAADRGARRERCWRGSTPDPDHVVGKIPPLWAEATVEKVAINAVMAGCGPEAMPVLVAALEAMLGPGLQPATASGHDPSRGAAR